MVMEMLFSLHCALGTKFTFVVISIIKITHKAKGKVHV